VACLPEDRPQPRRTVGETNHHCAGRRREEPDDARHAGLFDDRTAAHEHDALDARSVLLREPERPDIADRPAHDVRSLHVKCVECSAEDIGDERLVLLPREVDRRVRPQPGRSRTIARSPGSSLINEGHPPGPTVPWTKRTGSPDPTSRTRRRTAGPSRSRYRSCGLSP
jgi:hypothetical protein